MRLSLFLAIAPLSMVLFGCGPNSSGLSDASAAQQIQARLENAQWEFFDGSHHPCSESFTIVSVKVTDKTVAEKSAIVEAIATIAAKRKMDARAMIQSSCFGVTWDVPFEVGHRGTWKARYNFQLWDSGWKLS